MVSKFVLVILFCSILLLLFSCKQNATILIQNLPENTPKNVEFYLASNLNKWNPKAKNYQFEQLENGDYQLKIEKIEKPFEFKITRGDWKTVEVGTDAQPINNRIFPKRKSKLTINIENWNDFVEQKSTALPNVRILNPAFPIKTLNTSRKIWIYLPTDYENSTKNYPVLYMHDGQNLFDLLTANNGEWQVDETLSKLENLGKLKLIVVGIDNGEKNRIEEYSPWKNPEYGGGKGAAYIDFIVQELKPFIDKNYRTKQERANTGIMGSSLGGLITMYAGMQYPQTFGRLGVFSPSFWWSDESYLQTQKTGWQPDTKIYMNVGKAEDEIMQKGTKKMEKTLKSIGYDKTNLHTRYVKNAKHNEQFWQQEFEAAVLWLFN